MTREQYIKAAEEIDLTQFKEILKQAVLEKYGGSNYYHITAAKKIVEYIRKDAGDEFKLNIDNVYTQKEIELYKSFAAASIILSKRINEIIELIYQLNEK